MTIIDFIKSNNAYFEDYITRSTYHSNNIEGNTISYAETYAIIFNDNSFKINAQPGEIYEVINHKYAINYMLENINNPFSEKLIREIAILINTNINDICGYRTTQVLIRGSEHIPLDSTLVNQAMMYFVHNYNNTEYDNIYNKIAQNHIAFEKIHPYSDGNGRTGRLLINYELLRNNLAPAIINKDNKDIYFLIISNNDINSLTSLIKSCSFTEMKRLKQFGYNDVN